MKGIRIAKFEKRIQRIKEELASLSDIEQISILHELVDDTPYKTQSYSKYMHNEYHIQHNKPHLVDQSLKKYKLFIHSNGDKEPMKTIRNRYSIRDYENRSLDYATFSQILHYSFGVKYYGRGAYNKQSFPFKYSNTQGGLNYLDLYIIINNVDTIDQGLYYYDFISDEICMVDKGNMRGKLSEINYQNEFTVYGNFVCFIVADMTRVVPKYYKRAYRFAHVDAGILTAYLQLLAEHNGMGSCAVAGYLEHNVEDLLNLSCDEYPLLAMSFGYKPEEG